jgi:hypothetical protein
MIMVAWPKPAKSATVREEQQAMASPVPETDESFSLWISVAKHLQICVNRRRTKNALGLK